jgi:hypothetical protein
MSMLSAKTPTTMPSIHRAESGVFGSYTLAAVAVVCSFAAGVLVSGHQRNEVPGSAAMVTTAAAPVAQSVTPQAAPVTEPRSSGAADVYTAGRLADEELAEYLKY